MCDFLTVVDSDIVQVALNALENILKAGEKFTARPNPYAIAIEECGGTLIFKNIIYCNSSHLYLCVCTDLYCYAMR